MCFSAEASFTAGAALVTAGVPVAALAARRAPRWLPVAVYPVAFGIQQLVEGLIWLDLAETPERHSSGVALAFLFFSHLFWPVWSPLSVWWLRRGAARAGILAGLTGLGAVVGLGLFAPPLAAGSVPIADAGGHVAYVTAAVYDGPFPPELVLAAYGFVVLVPFLVSGVRAVAAFGALIAAALAISLAVHSATVISVWCFLAAVVSAIVVVAVLRVGVSAPGASSGTPLR